MLLRLMVALFALVISIPVQACPFLQPEPTPARDCCDQTENCPKPVQVQPCFDCVADIRTTAVAPAQSVDAVAPVSFELYSLQITALRLPERDHLSDNRNTYLRIGALRL